MIMRKSIRWFCIAIFSCLLGSCNLFIDDEVEDGDNTGGFKNVPEHSGKGYDEAVTVKDGNCEVTYRLKKNVRHVEDDQLKYITYVKHDETGLLMEVHYAGNTPKEVLPVPGEILHCTNTSKFEWGCNHLVQSRTDVDGVHKYLLTFAKLDDTFEELRINGSLVSEEYEEAYSVPEEPLDENGDPLPVTSTRAADEGSFDVSFVDDGFSLTIPMGFDFPPFETSKGLTFKLSTEGTYYKVTNTFNFDDFSLDNMKAKLTQDVEQSFVLQVSGGIEGDKRLKRWKPIKGKVFTVGPVVIVLFLNVDLSVEGSLMANITAERSEHVVYYYTLDFYNMTCKEDKHVIESKDWGVSASVEGNLGLRLALQLGLGIYGKVLSIRVVPSLYAGFEAKLPIVSYKQSDGVTYDIKDGLGITFKVLLDLTIGVFLDISLSAVIGDAAANSVQEMQGQLDKLVDLSNSNSDVYKELSKTAPTEDLNDVVKDKNKEEGLTTKLATWTIYQKHFPWFPKIKDKSFKVTKVWDSYKQKMSFKAEYKIEKEGFFAALGTKYVPALQIKDGQTVITTLFPDEGGDDAIVKKGSTYHFTMGGAKDDITYTAIPCYYSRPISRHEPDALDKGLPFCATSPSISISDIVMTSCQRDYSEWGGYGENGDYEWRYTFYLKTYTSLLGAANMYDWGIKELKSGTEKYHGAATESEDGTYVMNWKFLIFTHTEGIKYIVTAFQPSYWVKVSDKKGDTREVKGKIWELNFYSNGDVEAPTPSYSRVSSNMWTGSHRSSQDDGSQTLCYLESIEKDGKVIWQRQ